MARTKQYSKIIGELNYRKEIIQMLDVIGLGLVAMDVFFHVDDLPVEDGFAIISDYKFLPGGSGTNVIVQISRLSGKTGFLAQVGDDSLGDEIKKNLINENVDDSGIKTLIGATSLNTKIVVDPNGRKFILLDKGSAFDQWSFTEGDLEYLRKGKIFYTDLLPQEPALSGLKAAKQAGLKTIVNLQMGLDQMKMLGVSRKSILDALQYVDIFAPCQHGFKQLCEAENLDKCNEIIRTYFDNLLICTIGEKGSIAYTNDNQKIYVPALPINAIDTTGAGDSYLGGLIYAHLIAHKPLLYGMEFATVCAGYTCERIGATASPNLTEAEEYLKSNQSVFRNFN